MVFSSFKLIASDRILNWSENNGFSMKIGKPALPIRMIYEWNSEPCFPVRNSL